MAQQAQDTFIAALEDGTERLVVKGEPFADNHELVRRDQAASKKDPGRVPLFRPLDLGEEEKAAPAPRPSRGGAKGGAA